VHHELYENMLSSPLYLTIMGELWARDGMATSPQILEATQAIGSTATRNNINTILARLENHGWVRSIRAAKGSGKGGLRPGRSPTLWLASISKEEFFQHAFGHVLRTFARIGRTELDPEAIRLIAQQVDQLPRSW
jgi:predicted transcriptional regulator